MSRLFLTLITLIPLGVFANNPWLTSSLERSNQSLNTHQKINSFNLDSTFLNQILLQLNSQNSINISLPRANGNLEKFKLSQTHVLAPELELKYPSLKSYKLMSTNGSLTRGRLEWTGQKLTMMLFTPNGRETLQLLDQSVSNYQFKSTQKGQVKAFSCGAQMGKPSIKNNNFSENKQYRAANNTLTKIRLAITTTEEYSAKFGNTKPLVLAEIQSSVNRLNEIFESEHALTFELVSSNDDLIFLSGSGDSFDDGDADQMIEVSQSVIDGIIGFDNYDLGHVYSAGGSSGLATLSSVCQSNKADGVTGSLDPTGDSFWIDFVAHEIGHQLGATHTFNGTSGSCSIFNRESDTAFEPGSGSTIMAYAGICFGENLQSNSIAVFHSESVVQINNELPESCGSNVTYESIHSSESNLNDPIANAGSDFNIPIKTPFLLEGTATDSDGDELSYQWDNTNLGASTSGLTIGLDSSKNPLFQSNFPHPKNKGMRFFPSIESILSKNNRIGETLPTTTRNINLTLKVTDSKGGYNVDKVVIKSNANIGEFKVSSHNIDTILKAQDELTVVWDVANTLSAPVNCNNIDINLLTFNNDQSEFCSTNILSDTPNNGSAVVILPDVSSSKSRLFVKCSNNVFFAINNANIDIQNGSSIAATNCLSSSGGVEMSPIAIPTGELEEEEVIVEGGGGGSMPWLSLFLCSMLLMARCRFYHL